MGLKEVLKKVLPDEAIVRLKKIVNIKNNHAMLKKHASLTPMVEGMYPKGINLLGDIQAESGIGQSVRIMAGIIKDADIPMAVVQTDCPGKLFRNEHTWDDFLQEEPVYDTNLIHIYPDGWAKMYLSFPKEWLDKRKNIAYWAWELETFPKTWIPCLQSLDEIWTPSKFVADCLRQYTDKPIHVVANRIPTSENPDKGRDYFVLPEDEFLFLTMYDSQSISERKNPLGAIRAYREFCEKWRASDKTKFKKIPGLVVKANHLKSEAEMNKLRQETQGCENVHFITENLTKEEVDSLISSADVLISLHRSEGFGLPVAEAMKMGTPVICTNWSSTTEFTDEKSTALVDYKLIPITKNIGPYEKGNRWADADTHHAAEWMWKLFSDEALYAQMKQAGMDKIEEVLGTEQIIKMLMKAYQG